MGRLAYFVQAAWAGMVRARALTLASTFTLAAALFVVGAFAMALGHGRDLMRAWGEGGHISCAIAPFVGRDHWQALQADAQALPGVKEVRLVLPEQALQDFCARGPEACALVEGVDASLLPAALHITPCSSMITAGSQRSAAGATAAVAAALAGLPGIEDIAYGAGRLQQVREAMRTCALLILSLGAMLCAAMVFMVSNTIRLMIYARQDEVRILRLVGATRWFVRAPFLLEGLTWGLSAGALGGLGLHGVDRLFAGALARAQTLLGHPGSLGLFSWSVLTVQLVVGALLGLGGSLLALHRFLDEDVA